jgi:hypothetical protein
MIPERIIRLRREIAARNEKSTKLGHTFTDISTLFVYSVPRNQWPLWAKAFGYISKPEDAGVGDVIARIIGPTNSEAFKTWHKRKFGVDCGCSGRQRLWNRLYPLKVAGTKICGGCQKKLARQR